MENQELIIEKINVRKEVLESKGKPGLDSNSTSLHFGHYPASAKRLVVDIDFHPADTMGENLFSLLVRIWKGNTLVFQPTPSSIWIESNPGTISRRMNLKLKKVKFSEPGSYQVEIVLDDQVVHREELLLD